MKVKKVRLIREIRFYTRSMNPRNRQIVVFMTSGKEYRFSEGKMRKELLDYDLPEPVISIIGKVGFKRAMSFVPEDDRYLIADSTGYYIPIDFGLAYTKLSPVTVQAQTDLDVVQNLLCELQAVTESFGN